MRILHAKLVPRGLGERGNPALGALRQNHVADMEVSRWRWMLVV